MKIILPFSIIAVCIGMYFLYISPTIVEVKSLAVKKASYEEVLAKSKELKAKRDDILIDYNNISEADISKLNKIVPETFNSVLFANDINTIATVNNLVVKDFRIDPQRTEDRSMIVDQKRENPYKTTVITFRLIGQYKQFAKFLADIESSLRLIDIVKLTVRSTGSGKNADESLEYLLEMNTYSLR